MNVENLNFPVKNVLPQHYRNATIDYLNIGRVVSDITTDCNVISSGLITECASITTLKRPTLLERGNTPLYHLSSGYIGITSDEIALENKSIYMFRFNNKVDLNLNIKGCLTNDNLDYINVSLHTEGCSQPHCYLVSYSTLKHVGICRVVLDKTNLHIIFDKPLAKGDSVHIGNTVVNYFL